MRSIKELLIGPKVLPDSLLWLQRKETWAGDVKANFIRMVGLALFTINEILNYHVFHAVDKKFHVGSILVILIWFIAAIDFHIVLRRHWLARATPYLMPSLDLFLTTWLLFLADGPRSPLVVIYFLIIALSGARLNPAVVLYTAGAASFGYLSVWDFTKHQKPEYLVPVYHLVIVILALWLMGIIIAHFLGRVFFLFHEMKSDRRPG